MLKWKFELEAFDITYRPRTSIRGQVLADFIAEKPSEEEPPVGMQSEEATPKPWVLFTDGSSCLDGSGAGLIVTNPEGEEFTYALRFEFDVSNNEAEHPTSGSKEGTYDQNQCTTICHDQWGLIQKIIPGTMVAMRWSSPSRICPFPEAQGKVKFLIVSIDYFTKWIEAKPVATITGSQVKKFVWDNIVCKFGLPGEIISDYGKQFRDNPFKDWCEKLNIRQRLGKDNRNWVEEVPHVLWVHRTMIKTSNGDTPFSLTYSTEAKEEKEQWLGKPEAKPGWKNTTMQKSETQASVQETLSTTTMKRAMPRKMEN
ncbi:reverse transcriptase domain-containing protein [Tanacetum coccineum]